MVSRNFWNLSIFACLSLLTLGAQPTLAAPSDAYTFKQAADQERFESLTRELRCLVCKNQNLADSDAPLAKDLRHKVYVLIEEKKSDAEIKQFLVSRYGRFILFSPPLSLATVFLWGFPALLLILLFGIVMLLLKV